MKIVQETELIFQVQSDSGNEYEVIFWHDGDKKMHAYCSCPAGENNIHCKHRLALLDGDDEDTIISENHADLKLLGKLIKGTTLETAYKEYLSAEKEYQVAGNNFKAAKSALNKAMKG